MEIPSFPDFKPAWASPLSTKTNDDTKKKNTTQDQLSQQQHPMDPHDFRKSPRTDGFHQGTMLRKSRFSLRTSMARR